MLSDDQQAAGAEALADLIKACEKEAKRKLKLKDVVQEDGGILVLLQTQDGKKQYAFDMEANEFYEYEDESEEGVSSEEDAAAPADDKGSDK